MLIKIRKGWEVSESQVTSESDFLNRRSILKGFAGAGMAASVGAFSPLRHAFAAEGDPSAGLYPVRRNELYTHVRPLTPEKIATTYNNYYEFGSHKSISAAAQALPIRPWTVKIDGMVEKEMEIDIDDLLAQMPLEERIYRHRCVERWSMVVPWSGFPLKELVKLAAPKSGAKYIVMQTFENKAIAPGQRQFWYPWPYIDGLTLEEANNDLSFLVTGLYGKPLPKQNGAPLRLATPWKYGFKQVKSIVRFSFTDVRPVSFWEKLLGDEYGFWANVNPEVPHPRWSQAKETDIGTGEDHPTLIFNGYSEFVADMYKDMKGQKLFM